MITKENLLQQIYEVKYFYSKTNLPIYKQMYWDLIVEIVSLGVKAHTLPTL